ncbi:hypothetical protein H2509_08160 [Stappia sp. F7233]|uniref:Lipoprotein n=1 Tax=Stappia albiluteola TaxID=2758565 RepID=A0A839ACB0_9HYPH|nr:hypothetical protein [Stappia albiluteola]MBA5777101.1 hypothetical protein [Stappia albiluteola]
MKLNNFLLISAFIVSGCQSTATSAPPEVHEPYELSSAQISTIHAAVRGVLKDPESARFGEIVAASNSEGVVSACGWVNAKNSYGGYTGDKPFLGVLTKGGFVPVSVGGTSNETAATLRVCARQGTAL